MMTTLRLLENWVSPALVRALGYALLHSLWQGAALAGLLAAALPLLRRHRPEVRYAASAAALAGLLLVVGVTFGYYYGQAPTGPAASLFATRQQVVLARLQATQAYPPAPARPLALGAALAQRAEPHLPLLVAAWALGLLLMGTRLAGGLVVAGRLRRVGTQALGGEWPRRLAALAARAGVRRPVALLESGRVRGPLVLGYLRPVVLLPLGAVAGLPPALLEALLAHELAHILRRDYLLNLALAAVEVLFFYHPAVWFMAASLRTERENCCDDQAAALCGGDRLRVARALAALAELEAALPTPHLALAASGTGGRHSLLARVRRLALGRPQATRRGEGLLLLLALLGAAGLGTGLALAAPARRPAPAALARPRANATPVSAAGAAGAARARPVQTGPGPRRPGSSSIVLEKDKKGRLKSLTLNGQPVPLSELGKKAKPSGKAGTVELIEVPAAPPLAWRMGSPRGFGPAPAGAAPPAEATEQARRQLSQALRDPTLTDETRQGIAQTLRQLDDGAVAMELRPASPFRLVPAPRRLSKGPSVRYRVLPNFSPPRITGNAFVWPDHSLPPRLQATPGLADGQLQLQQAPREPDRAPRQWPLTQREAQAEARTTARRAQLEARIATAEAELRALDAETAAPGSEAELGTPPRRTTRVPAAPRAPQIPQAPPAFDQTHPVPPPPPPTPGVGLRDELRRDGLIGATDKSYSFELTNRGGRVNGRALTPAQVTKYRAFLGQPDSEGKSTYRLNYTEH